MHNHFADTFNSIESGIRLAEYGMQVADGGSSAKPTPTATSVLFTRPNTAAGKSKPIPVTPTGQVKEAIKDGKISKNEQTAFDKTPVAKQVVKDEQKRLADAVKKADGNDYQRDASGKLVLNDGKPLAGIIDVTDHEQQVAALSRDKDKHDLTALDKQIEAIKASGSPVGLEALQAQRAIRVGEETKVAAVVQDKTSLKGTLAAEKVDLQAAQPANAADDYQPLREKAAKWIGQLNANGGQFYEGNDWFGDDWDTSKVDFNRLADRFHEDPSKLKDFAKVQGKDDGSGGNDKAGMEKHIADVAADDPAEAARISLRYQAATELTGIFEDYNTARDAADGNNGRIKQIDAETGILDTTIAADKKALSSETLAQIDTQQQPIGGIIPTAPAETTQPMHKPSPSLPSDSSSTGPKPGAAGTPDVPTAKDVPIDYATPENRAKVIEQAAKQNLLPSGNTSFDDKGQAVYTVQKGDSYWHIADMSDGKAPHEFDAKHFAEAVNSNSTRLGRDPQVGMLYPNDQVVIPNRSIADLVRLLNLPTVQAVEPTDEQR